MNEIGSTIAFVLGLSLVPLMLVVLTSFAKVAIVLTVLRNALGTPGMPPGLVITALAALLTGFIMAPVASDVADALEPEIDRLLGEPPTPTDRDAASRQPAYERALEPVRTFLEAHARPEDRRVFTELAQALREGHDHAHESAQTPIADDQFLILAPAFALGELREAFLIGVLVLLPFLIIDLVVASSLVALGLSTLPVATIALPLKLTLFVLVDGWQLLLSGLVAGYLS